MRFRTIAIGLAATVSLLVACGNGDDDGGVASLGDGEAAAPASAAPDGEDAEAALQAFSECVREQGIEDFPDLQVDGDGRIEFGFGLGGEDGDEDAEPPSEEEMRAMREAMQACDDLLPEGTFGGGELSPEDRAAMEDAFVEFAACMREHGVEVPDPQTEGGGFVIGPGPDGQGDDEGIDVGDPDVQEALGACQPILDEARPA